MVKGGITYKPQYHSLKKAEVSIRNETEILSAVLQTPTTCNQEELIPSGRVLGA